MSSDEKVGKVICSDISGYGLVVTGGARVFQYRLVVAGVNPNKFERGRA